MKQRLLQICMAVFTVTLPLFMLMGTAIVLLQLVGIVMGNGALVLGINSALKTYATWVSSVCAFSGFFVGYLKPKKNKPEASAK